MRNTLLPIVCLLLSACVATGDYVDNTAGTAVRNIPLDKPGPLAGVGIGADDISAMTDRMMRSMLQNPVLTRSDYPPQIILDDTYFVNESSQIINKKLITNKLRVSLNRAANGRMLFVARHNASMVEKERALKRDGRVDVGTTGLSEAVAGGDFRLSGTFASLDQRSASNGAIQRYSQIIFEMIDLERGVVVWSDSYEVQRAGQDDIVYR